MRYPLILMLVACLPAMNLPAAEIYTWTDADGLLHITDLPPPPGARLAAVAKDKRPVVKMLPPGEKAAAAAAGAREQISESRDAWQKVQALSEKRDAAQAAYEDAAAAVVAEKAKYTYSAKRRRAPRQTVTDLEKAAQAAFTKYRQILDAYNKAELAAREAEQRATRAIDAVSAGGSHAPPDTPAPATLDRQSSREPGASQANE